MKAKFDLDVEKPEQIERIISPSLDQAEDSKFSIDSQNNLTIKIESESLATLWGCINSALRVVKLSNSVIN